MSRYTVYVKVPHTPVYYVRDNSTGEDYQWDTFAEIDQALDLVNRLNETERTLAAL